MDKQINEMLNILQEECAELIQIICKIRRFGEESVHSEFPNKTNRYRLQEEIGDLLALIEILQAHEYINLTHVNMLKHNKFDKLKKWSSIDIDYNKLV